MLEVGKTRPQRAAIGIGMIGAGIAAVLYKVFSGATFAVLDVVLLGGIVVGGYALIDPKLAGELLDKAGALLRRNGGT